jgi:hypothetical protein
MVPIAVRAFSTIFAVTVAVLVSARWGETDTGKLIAAIIIAVAIAAIEWFMLWSPKHLAWARRALDPRSIWTGIWVQDVKMASGVRQGNRAENNAFAIFVTDYNDGYWIAGRAYDPRGEESARWQSRGDPMFTKNGRGMSYVWEGVVIDPAVETNNPSRTGLATMTLAADNAGSGWVEHVALNRRLDFDLQRVTRSWLDDGGLSGFEPQRLVDSETQHQFAIALAKKRARTQA